MKKKEQAWNVKIEKTHILLDLKAELDALKEKNPEVKENDPEYQQIINQPHFRLKERLSDRTYALENGQVMEAKIRGNEIILEQRDKFLESEHFLHWVKTFELTAAYEEDVLTISSRFKDKEVDYFKIADASDRLDIIFKEDNTVYISLRKGYEFYRINLTDEGKIEWSLLGKTEDQVWALLEVEGALIIGTREGHIHRFKEGELELLMKLPESIYSFGFIEGCLAASHTGTGISTIDLEKKEFSLLHKGPNRMGRLLISKGGAISTFDYSNIFFLDNSLEIVSSVSPGVGELMTIVDDDKDLSVFNFRDQWLAVNNKTNEVAFSKAASPAFAYAKSH